MSIPAVTPVGAAALVPVYEAGPFPASDAQSLVQPYAAVALAPAPPAFWPSYTAQGRPAVQPIVAVACIDGSAHVDTYA